MNTVQVIEKLIQMAVHPSSDPNEAANAAMRAVKLIDAHCIPIGADVTIIRDVSDYKPPTAEEMETIDELLRKKAQPQSQAQYARDNQPAGGMITQDNLPMTGMDAFRQRLVDAWRALRDERIRLQSEIYRYEQETRRKFQGDGRPW
jgi:hypothetical protein